MRGGKLKEGKLRARSKIVLCVVSLGIAALFYLTAAGLHAHSWFKIPLDVSTPPPKVCDIKKNINLHRLLLLADLESGWVHPFPLNNLRNRCERGSLATYIRYPATRLARELTWTTIRSGTELSFVPVTHLFGK